jgi:hypothetical protein
MCDASRGRACSRSPGHLVPDACRVPDIGSCEGLSRLLISVRPSATEGWLVATSAAEGRLLANRAIRRAIRCSDRVQLWQGEGELPSKPGRLRWCDAAGQPNASHLSGRPASGGPVWERKDSSRGGGDGDIDADSSFRFPLTLQLHPWLFWLSGEPALRGAGDLDSTGTRLWARKR